MHALSFHIPILSALLLFGDALSVIRPSVVDQTKETGCLFIDVRQQPKGLDAARNPNGQYPPSRSLEIKVVSVYLRGK
jgi:hypothetical protein